ncbi:allose kinase [Paenibacillus kribbensis]|uniref:allose kinase n=1 Tax=Paenibacillus TaxID=44249 RepID=UPI00024EF877|nr:MULTISPECIES: allose kinase [Paenibacillus]EHS57782.1 ROK family protein [Paenibacillus sp. Aloe-11]MEC0236540.1 allose kinase [Paenibacillus kribbensis]
MDSNERIQGGYTIGIDIGGTNFRIGLLSEMGELRHFHIESSRLLYAEGEPQDNLRNYITSYIQKHPEAEIKGIGIGFPSVVSKDKKTVYSTPNIEGFNQVNVVDPLESALGIPVYLDNDVNFLLLTEIVAHKLERRGIVVGFYLGTGFGNSIYYEDHFIAGKHGSAAELGHVPVLGRQDLCSCGNPGCIEQYASGKRLRELHELHFAGTPFGDIFVKYGSHEIIQDFLEAVAVVIATEINILDPDYIVLGGGVLHMSGFPKKELEAKIYSHARKPFPAEGLNYIYAKDNQEAGVIGAGYRAWRGNSPALIK